MTESKAWRSIFPILFKLTPDLFEKVWQEMLLELQATGDLHQAVAYLPLYLKQRGFSLREQQIGYFESLFWLKSQEDHKFISANGFVRANPSLSPIYLSVGARDLGREEGLYAIYRTDHEVRVEKVNETQAAVLDLLLDDQKFTWQQLIELGTLESDMKVLKQKGMLEV